MGRLLTADDEELLRSFRPHVFSHVPSYLLAFTWLAWAAVGWNAERALGGTWGFWSGYAAVVFLVLLHGYARHRWGGQARALPLHAAAVAVVLAGAVADQAGALLPGALAEYNPLAIGAALTATSLIVREAKRQATHAYVTTQRVVVRHGLAPRTETVLLLKDASGMSRSLYTGFGHTVDSFGEPLVLEHLANGILWAGRSERAAPEG